MDKVASYIVTKLFLSLWPWERDKVTAYIATKLFLYVYLER